MNIDDFLTAVRAMVGLPPIVTEHLIGLASQMTDMERADAVTRLQPMNNDIQEKQEEILRDVEAGEKELHAIGKAIRLAQEKSEQGDADAILPSSTIL